MAEDVEKALFKLNPLHHIGLLPFELCFNQSRLISSS